MPDSLFDLIGKIMHHCGALEFLTNNAIKTLSTDSILANEIVNLHFARRISILRQLLQARTTLSKSDIKSLCDEIDEISKWRNDIAHNPIISEQEQITDESSYIVVLKGTSGIIDTKKKITRRELVSIVNRSSKTSSTSFAY